MNVKKTKSSKKIILKITMSMTMASGETFRLAEVEAGELKWNKFACHDFMCRLHQLLTSLLHWSTLAQAHPVVEQSRWRTRYQMV